MKIRLSTEDAERLGCPRLVEYQEGKLMAREAVAIQSQTGWRPEKLARALNGAPVVDDAGEPVHLVDDAGAPVLDEAGQPVQLRDVDAEALLIAAWIAVRRANPQVAYADFDIDLLATGFGEAAEDDPGKDH